MARVWIVVAFASLLAVVNGVTEQTSLLDRLADLQRRKVHRIGSHNVNPTLVLETATGVKSLKATSRLQKTKVNSKAQIKRIKKMLRKGLFTPGTAKILREELEQRRGQANPDPIYLHFHHPGGITSSNDESSGGQSKSDKRSQAASKRRERRIKKRQRYRQRLKRKLLLKRKKALSRKNRNQKRKQKTRRNRRVVKGQQRESSLRKGSRKNKGKENASGKGRLVDGQQKKSTSKRERKVNAKQKKSLSAKANGRQKDPLSKYGKVEKERKKQIRMAASLAKRTRTVRRGVQKASTETDQIQGNQAQTEVAGSSGGIIQPWIADTDQASGGIPQEGGVDQPQPWIADNYENPVFIPQFGGGVNDQLIQPWIAGNDHTSQSIPQSETDGKDEPIKPWMANVDQTHTLIPHSTIKPQNEYVQKVNAEKTHPFVPKSDGPPHTEQVLPWKAPSGTQPYIPQTENTDKLMLDTEVNLQPRKVEKSQPPHLEPQSSKSEVNNVLGKSDVQSDISEVQNRKSGVKGQKSDVKSKMSDTKESLTARLRRALHKLRGKAPTLVNTNGDSSGGSSKQNSRTANQNDQKSGGSRMGILSRISKTKVSNLPKGSIQGKTVDQSGEASRQSKVGFNSENSKTEKDVSSSGENTSQDKIGDGSNTRKTEKHGKKSVETSIENKSGDESKRLTPGKGDNVDGESSNEGSTGTASNLKKKERKGYNAEKTSSENTSDIDAEQRKSDNNDNTSGETSSKANDGSKIRKSNDKNSGEFSPESKADPKSKGITSEQADSSGVDSSEGKSGDGANTKKTKDQVSVENSNEINQNTKPLGMIKQVSVFDPSGEEKSGQNTGSRTSKKTRISVSKRKGKTNKNGAKRMGVNRVATKADTEKKQEGPKSKGKMSARGGPVGVPVKEEPNLNTAMRNSAGEREVLNVNSLLPAEVESAVEEGSRGDPVGVPVSMCNCMVSGDPHFYLYDGQVIHFAGACTYTLSRSVANDIPCAFNVEVTNENVDNSDTVSRIHSVKFEAVGNSIHLKRNRTVLVNNVLLIPPLSLANGALKITYVGSLVEVYLVYCRIRVGFDGKHLVRVQIPSTLGKQVYGLCGDCNNVQDDFSLKNGVDVSSEPDRFSQIADSYMVSQGCLSIERPATCQDNSAATGACETAIGQELFTDCLATLNGKASQVRESCIMDYCHWEGDGSQLDDVICKTLESLASLCRDAGLIVPWRTPTFCTMSCVHSQYSTSVSGCQPSCVVTTEPETCDLGAWEGCACGEGQFLSGTECVSYDNCGCYRNENNFYYPLGHVIVTSSCETRLTCKADRTWGKETLTKCVENAVCDLQDGQRVCTCNDGYTGDGYSNCVLTDEGQEATELMVILKEEHLINSKVCFVMGDPHYLTFDNVLINFMGACRYTLAMSTIENDPCFFNVEVKNERRYGLTEVSFTKFVLIKFRALEIKLGMGNTVHINGQQRYTPVLIPNTLSITHAGFLQVDTICGIRVEFDGVHQIAVTIPQTYKGNVRGICGNANDLPEDDDISKNGTDSIGDAFVVPDDTITQAQIDAGETETECMVMELNPSCTKAGIDLAKSEMYCGAITKQGGDFAPCTEVLGEVEVHNFVESCVYDLCTFQYHRLNMSTQLCRGLEAFASKCSKLGISLNWRHSHFCPMMCEDGSHYNPEMSGCQPTVTDPVPPISCPLMPREGCQCDAGYLLSGTTCVKEEERGCEDSDGNYFPVSHTKNSAPILEAILVIDTGYTSRDCTTRFLCTSSPTVAYFSVTPYMTCDVNAECVPVDGNLMCQCLAGYTGDGTTCTADSPSENLPPRANTCDCMLASDHVYNTFDGQLLAFYGDCDYILALHDNVDSDCTFIVTVSNYKTSQGSFHRSVVVTVYGVTVTLGPNYHIMVGGVKHYLPVITADMRVSVTLSGRIVTLVAQCGLTVAFDGDDLVSVQADKVFAGQMVGLCGNCDGVDNDFVLPDGTDLTHDADRSSKVADHYRTGDERAQEVPSACTALDRIIAQGNDKCGFLLPGSSMLFQTCLDVISGVGEWIRESCVSDLCDGTGEKCDYYEALVFACAQNNEPVTGDWRTTVQCGLDCGPNQQYSPSMSGCQGNCLFPSLWNCPIPDSEGCACEPGTLLSDTECVPYTECGCKESGGFKTYPLYASYTTDTCDQEVTCVPFVLGVVLQTTSLPPCVQGATCSLVDGERKCKCDAGYSGDGTTSCISTEVPQTAAAPVTPFKSAVGTESRGFLSTTHYLTTVQTTTVPKEKEAVLNLIALEHGTTRQHTSKQARTTKQQTTTEPTIKGELTTLHRTTPQPASLQYTTVPDHTTTKQHPTTEPNIEEDLTTLHHTTPQPASLQYTTVPDHTTTKQNPTTEPNIEGELTTLHHTTPQLASLQYTTVPDHTTTKQNPTTEQTIKGELTTLHHTTPQLASLQYTTVPDHTTTKQNPTTEQTIKGELTTLHHTTPQLASLQYTTVPDHTKTKQNPTTEPNIEGELTTLHHTTPQLASLQYTTVPDHTTTKQNPTTEPNIEGELTTLHHTTPQLASLQYTTVPDHTTTKQNPTTEPNIEGELTTLHHTTPQLASLQYTTVPDHTTTKQNPTTEPNIEGELTILHHTTPQPASLQYTTAAEYTTTKLPIMGAQIVSETQRGSPLRLPLLANVEPQPLRIGMSTTKPELDTTSKPSSSQIMVTTHFFRKMQPTTVEFQTTQKPSTVEFQTPHEPATAEFQTTQKPSTVEFQTIQKLSTVESQTTHKPATDEFQTTQKPSTAEFQTTQKPSTVEFQTTHKPVTVGFQTAQKLSTAEFQTTQKPATAEFQTTQKPPTVEFQTTQKPPTVEFQTVQKLSTAEFQTTHKPPTVEFQTTQKPPTVEFQTTQQPTTTAFQLTTTQQANTVALHRTRQQPVATGFQTIGKQSTTAEFQTTTIEFQKIAESHTLKQQPATTGFQTTTQQPVTVGFQTTTQRPTTTALRTSTQQPATVQIQTSTQQPTTVQIQTSTQQPTTMGFRTSTEQPTATAFRTTQQSTITESRTSTQHPTSASQSRAGSQDTIPETNTTQQSETTQQPKEGSKTSQQSTTVTTQVNEQQSMTTAFTRTQQINAVPQQSVTEQPLATADTKTTSEQWKTTQQPVVSPDLDSTVQPNEAEQEKVTPEQSQTEGPTTAAVRQLLNPVVADTSTNNTVPEEFPCSCSIKGDPHAQTFDHALINYFCACRYLLSAADVNGTECDFRVEGRSEYRPGPHPDKAYVEYIDVFTGSQVTRLKRHLQAEVNGEPVSFPNHTAAGSLTLHDHHMYFTTPCGLVVCFDGLQRAYIKAPTMYKNVMTGICGNCDGVRSDDVYIEEPYSTHHERDKILTKRFMLYDPTTTDPQCVLPT